MDRASGEIHAKGERYLRSTFRSPQDRLRAPHDLLVTGVPVGMLAGAAAAVGTAA
jgi:hypothetical protein